MHANPKDTEGSTALCRSHRDRTSGQRLKKVLAGVKEFKKKNCTYTNQFSLTCPDHGLSQPRAGALSSFSGSREEAELPILPAVIPTCRENAGASVGAGSSPMAALALQRASPPCALGRHQPCGITIGDARHPATNDPRRAAGITSQQAGR